MYSRCELVFELNDAEAAKHPEPWKSVILQGEFRSPKHKTFLILSYWDGGRKLVIRFAPTEAGTWQYRLTSNIDRWNRKEGTLEATASQSPGFIQRANLHHWQYTENLQPHLWMGDTSYQIATIDDAFFDAVLAARSAQKFTHIRGHVLADNATAQPDAAHFQRLDKRIAALNEKGIVFDAILGRDENQLAKMLPDRASRERFIKYMVARYAAFNVTWQLVQEFEEYENGREFCREIGLLLKQHDPYAHPRTTHTVTTSAPLLADGWMDHVLYQSASDDLGAIEHQLYPVPFVNAEFAYENSGAGASHPHHVDTNEFRRMLWNATMNGQYPTFGNTGTYGGRKVPQSAKFVDSPGAKQMAVWFDFFNGTRHWELEPFFDLDGGRAMALPGVEYIVYIEKPTGPIEVRVIKHGYDVRWFNPITGEFVVQKEYKGERFVGEPPDKSHDWVLHLSREDRKKGMLNSWKFESRLNLMQEVENITAKLPFDIAQPTEALSLSKPNPFEIKLKRETRGTREMRYLWTLEPSAGSPGYRVVGTGAKGELRIPEKLFSGGESPAMLRVYGMNANGKVYQIDRSVTVKP
jgi:hypothetical protein